MLKNRTGRIVRSLLAVSAVAPLVVTAVACGSAPTDESSASTSQEIAIGCTPTPHPGDVRPMCVSSPSPVPTITPTPIPTVFPIFFPSTCSWDALSSGHLGATRQNMWTTGSATAPDGCVSAISEPFGLTAIQLMKAGCSEPIHWTAWNPHMESAYGDPYPGLWADQADAHLMLCPSGQGLETIVNDMGCGQYPNGVCNAQYKTPHASAEGAAGFADYTVPAAGDGYFWAFVAQDPTCGSTGCMMTSTDGEAQME